MALPGRPPRTLPFVASFTCPVCLTEIARFNSQAIEGAVNPGAAYEAHCDETGAAVAEHLRSHAGEVAG